MNALQLYRSWLCLNSLDSEASLTDEPLPCVCRTRLQRLPETEEEESDESVYELEEIETGINQNNSKWYTGGSSSCKRKMWMSNIVVCLKKI